MTISPLTQLASPVSVFFIFKPSRTNVRSPYRTSPATTAQLHSLAIGVEQFLAQVDEQNPDLSEASGDYVEEVMRINPPVDPLFRVGEIGLGYDKERDLVVLFVKELLTEEDDQDTAAVVRFWASRTQVRMLARWGVEIISRGRPICPQCGQPEEPEGHFCPKKNGYRH